MASTAGRNWRLGLLALFLAAVAAPASGAPAPEGDPNQAPGAQAPLEPADPARTRLEFVPTARMLGRGDVAIRPLGYPPIFVQIGLTDRISFGAAPIGTGALLTPKVQLFRGATTQAAVGALHVVEPGYSGGLAYAVATHGSEDAAFTVGLAWTYSGFFGGRRLLPVLLIGGERRITPGRKIVAEALVVHAGFMSSVGVRVIRTHFAADLGAAVLVAVHGGILAIPVCNLSWRF